MNLYTFMGLDVEEGKEVNSHRKTFIKRAIAFIKSRRQANLVMRNSITRDRSGAHERLAVAFLARTQFVMEIYRPEFLRKPTVTNIEKLYRHHKEKHGFPGYEALIVWIGNGSVVRTPLKRNMLDVIMSPLFNDLKTGRSPEIPFMANDVTYPCGYYLVDGIYPELATLVKTISETADDDHKRSLYNQKQKSTRKDME
nr:hypothetical protein [Tanacetum cinerariifolium]